MRQGSTYTAHEQSTIRAGGAAAVLPAQNHHMSVAGPTRGDEHKADQNHRPTGLERVTVERGALTSTGLEPELDQRFHVTAHERKENTMASGDHCRFGTGPTGRPDGTVIHFDCDDYGDNTMTDLYTGAILRYRPKHWVVTENA